MVVLHLLCLLARRVADAWVGQTRLSVKDSKQSTDWKPLLFLNTSGNFHSLTLFRFLYVCLLMALFFHFPPSDKLTSSQSRKSRSYSIKEVFRLAPQKKTQSCGRSTEASHKYAVKLSCYHTIPQFDTFIPHHLKIIGLNDVLPNFWWDQHYFPPSWTNLPAVQ